MFRVVLCREGSWDSIHIMEVVEKAGGRQAHYKLTSTIILWLQTQLGPAGAGGAGGVHAEPGKLSLGGSLTRQLESDAAVVDDRSHIVKIGQMVEVHSTLSLM